MTVEHKVEVRVTFETKGDGKTFAHFANPALAMAFLQLLGTNPVTDDRKLTRLEIAVSVDEAAWIVTGEWKPQMIQGAGGIIPPGFQ